MGKKFFKHFAVISGGTFISMVLGFLTTPVITRAVNPLEYGKYSIFTMYANVAVMILYLGLDQSLIRYFYENSSTQYRQGLLFKCLKYPAICTLTTTFFVFFLELSGFITFELGQFSLILICFYTLVQILYRFSLLLLRLQYKSKLYSLLGIIQKICYVAVALGLIFYSNLNKALSLEIATTSAAFFCLFISIFCEKRLWNPKNFRAGACTVPQNDLLRYAFPYIFSMGITTLFQYIDKISLNVFCSYKDVGIYSSTMTLVHVFAIVQTTFNTLWAPMALEHYENEKKDVGFYQNANQIITVIMFFIGFSLILCKDVFSVMLGKEYREAAYILPFLIFNPIMYTISETTVTGLVFMKKSGMHVVVSIVSCVVNLIGNFVLVPQLGCKGAAISTGVSYIVFFTMRTLLSNRFYYVDFKLKKFYVITLVAISYALYNTFIPFNHLSIILYCACIALLVLLYKETMKTIILYGKNFLN